MGGGHGGRPRPEKCDTRVEPLARVKNLRQFSHPVSRVLHAVGRLERIAPTAVVRGFCVGTERRDWKVSGRETEALVLREDRPRPFPTKRVVSVG